MFLLKEFFDWANVANHVHENTSHIADAMDKFGGRGLFQRMEVYVHNFEKWCNNPLFIFGLLYM